MVGQRCLLQYQLPWLENIELVDVSLPHIRSDDMDTINSDLLESTRMMNPVEMGGEGWGSNEATQMVLINLFYITAKVGYSMFHHCSCILCKILKVL